MIIIKRTLLIGIAIGLGCYHSSAQSSIDLFAQTSEINDAMVHYNADKQSILRFYVTGDGNNNSRYNSPERRTRRIQIIDEYLLLLKKYNFDQLSINGKVDYLLFKRDLDNEKDQLNEEERMYAKISYLLPFASKIYDLEKPRRRGMNVDAAQIARTLNSISKQIDSSMSQLLNGDNIEMGDVNFAMDAIRVLQGMLKNYYNFYNGYDPLFTWWVPKTYVAVDGLLTDYIAAIKKKGKFISNQKPDGSGIVGHPIGREEMIRQLKKEFIPYTPEELIDIANKEFAWCDAELLKASHEMGFGDNWKAAQEKVKNTYVDPGKQPNAMFDLYKESVDFLKKNDLLSIPPLSEEDWGMYMLSPESQLTSPFFLGGQSLLVAYPTNSMNYEDKMMSLRGNNPHFARAVVHHELLAGHHLQGFMNARYKVYRNFDTPFWSEGNSLYWELILWDLKFPRSPEDKIGMLFWRMHRCARILFSINYHLGKWSPQQCIDFLVDRVGHERANAEGEVRRSFNGSYGPLYQVAYMIGGLQFYALKKELVDSGKMSYKQYHDAILRENAMPIEMLRALLVKQPLKRDFVTQWRFYGK